MPHIQYKDSLGHLLRYPINRSLVTIGSAAECDLVIGMKGVAANHCTVFHEPGQYRIESSERGTPFFVEGKKQRSHDLHHGDVVVVGSAELVFSALDAEETQPQTEGESARTELGDMHRIVEFSELLLRPAKLDDLLNELIDQIVALTSADTGFLVLSDDSAEDYSIRVARNLERQPVDQPNELLSDKIIQDVITKREAQIISDAYSDTRFQNSLSVINLKLSSVMCVPLIVRGDLLGLIYVGNNNVRNLFTKEQLEFLKVFATQAALFIKNAKLLNELRDETTELSDQLEMTKFGEIIGACPQMIEIYKRVEKVASTEVTLMVTGDTGTGKELIAREIHQRSPRSRGPFVTVNCGAIPENLIESELFGHVRGAFTGAVANHTGKFQAADGGTLFLDEIGELPLQLQVKLLRALQDRTVQRVGASSAVPVNIRIVAATNRDLKKAVESGTFREDLYFRLNVIGVELPPLRDRGDDVILIARYLVQRFAKEFGKDIDPAKAFDETAVQAMLQFSWPGNIRQLENHIKKALVLAEAGQISAADLDLQPSETGKPAEDAVLPLSEARDNWQRTYINRILALHNGNRTRTAHALGVDPRTIFRHLEKQGKEES